MSDAGRLEDINSKMARLNPLVDWPSPAGLCIVGDVAVKDEPRADLTSGFLLAAVAEKR